MNYSTMSRLIAEDWVTHGRNPWNTGFWAVAVQRFGVWRYGFTLAVVRVPLSGLYKLLKFLNQVLGGVELPCEATVGRRLRIEHFGGIIVSGDAVIGDDVVLRQGVTIGLKNVEDARSPIIGNRVDIGAGAKLLGPIRIGDGAVIGANAVVLCDVPAGAIAVGIPARIKLRGAQRSALREVA